MTSIRTADPSGAAARFRVPIVSDPEVVRSRLTHLLSQRFPVTVVTGPAGAGKTTAVASWVQHSTTTSWTRVDRRDNDITAFWGSILESLELASPGCSLSLQAPPVEAGLSFVDALLSTLGQMPNDVCLAVDDMQHVDDPLVLESVAHLAENLPTNARLVVISRTTPSIRQARLRMEGRLLEIDAPQLCLTEQETADFLRSESLEVSDEFVQALHAHTEGWVAGIRLAALALHSGNEPDTVASSFSGSDPAVADYLAAEIFAQLPSRLRSFLEKTSVCASITSDLARTLTGAQDSADILEELVRRNMFTARLDRRRDQYRYHDLLRNYLETELGRRDPGLQRQLHATTAHWCLAQGDAMHAMEHFAMAAQIPELSALAADRGVTTLLDGQGHRLLTLLEDVPAHDARCYNLWLLGAAAALENDDLAKADAFLHRLSGCQPPSDHRTIVLAAAVDLCRSRYTKEVGTSLQRLEAVWTAPSGSSDVDLYAHLQRGVARLYTGQYEPGISDLQYVDAVSAGAGREAMRLAALSFLAGATGSMSDYSEMRRYATAALESAQSHGWGHSQVAAHMQMLLSWSSYLQMDAQQALDHAEAASAALGAHCEPDVELAARAALVFARYALATLTHDELGEYMTHLRRLSDAQMSPAVLANIGPELVRICLDLGERKWAREVAVITWELAPDPGEPHVMRALLLLDSGQPASALKSLKPLMSDEAACHSLVTRVIGLVVAATLENREGNDARASALLAEALELGRTREILQPFVTRPEAVEMLVAGMGRFGHSNEFAQRLVELALGQQTDAPARLTASELAVLRELPSLLSIREIADVRKVSVNTLKAQTRSIYRKLGVSGRREAVEAARRMRLL